jgi:hypothetical protein
MTTPPASFSQFGRTLAFAEQTLTATLRQHLAERDTAPETWYALRLIATGGPGLARQALSSELAGSRTLNPDSTRELLARLEADGLIRGDSELDLTAEGEALHRSLRESTSLARRRDCWARSLPAKSSQRPHPAGGRRAGSAGTRRRRLAAGESTHNTSTPVTLSDHGLAGTNLRR